jgi:hypothetical protein
MNLFITNDAALTNKVANPDIEEIIKGELSAIEAYKKVMTKDLDSKVHSDLEIFLIDHRNSLDYWDVQLRELGIEPDNDAGTWGRFVNVLTKASSAIGETSLLMVIREGEEHGLNLYKKMEHSEYLTNSQRERISNVYIPRQIKHLKYLDQLID